MLERGAIREAIHCKDQFVSHLFLESKKDKREPPVINLKDLNTFIPHKHFKMKGLHLLKKILEQGDYLCKSDLKDNYLCVPLNKQRNMYVSNGRVPYTNSFVCFLDFVQLQGCLQN